VLAFDVVEWSSPFDALVLPLDGGWRVAPVGLVCGWGVIQVSAPLVEGSQAGCGWLSGGLTRGCCVCGCVGRLGAGNRCLRVGAERRARVSAGFWADFPLPPARVDQREM